MTRTYALKRLLEHGPMTRPELLDCTRWNGRDLSKTLDIVVKTGAVQKRRVAGRSLRSTAWLFEAVMP